MSNNKKQGFTLAEMLLTIALLGVLAAVLIPAIQSIQPNQNKVLFRKGYKVLEQTISTLINDDNLYSTEDGFALTDGSKVLCNNFVDALNWAEQNECPAAGTSEWLGTTPDGIDWYFYYASSEFPKTYNEYPSIVLFDVNGHEKKPNCTYSASSTIYPTSPESYKKCGNGEKPDTFAVGIRWDGKLHVGGAAADSDSYATEILGSITNNLNDK